MLSDVLPDELLGGMAPGFAITNEFDSIVRDVCLTSLKIVQGIRKQLCCEENITPQLRGC